MPYSRIEVYILLQSNHKNVENPFGYIGTHFIQGSSFEGFDDFLRKLKAFEATMNTRVHSVTKKSPQELFEMEQGILLSLPMNPVTGELKRYIGYKEEFRKVTSDCLISYEGNRYSVPHHFARSEVWVRVSKGMYLQVYSQQNVLIAIHTLRTGKGEVIINEEHYRGYRANTHRVTFDLSAQKLRDRFSSCYEKLEEFLQSAKAQKRINPGYNIYRIASLLDHYHVDDCIQAMENCFAYNCFSANFVQGYITHHAQRKVEIIQRVMFKDYTAMGFPSVKRNLKEYQL